MLLNILKYFLHRQYNGVVKASLDQNKHGVLLHFSKIENGKKLKVYIIPDLENQTLYVSKHKSHRRLERYCKITKDAIEINFNKSLHLDLADLQKHIFAKSKLKPNTVLVDENLTSYDVQEYGNFFVGKNCIYDKNIFYSFDGYALHSSRIHSTVLDAENSAANRKLRKIENLQNSIKKKQDQIELIRNSMVGRRQAIAKQIKDLFKQKNKIDQEILQSQQILNNIDNEPEIHKLNSEIEELSCKIKSLHCLEEVI